MNIDTLTDLYRHMQWADSTVWKSVFASESSEADTRIREYLYHIHLVQHAFLLIWRNQPLGTTYPTFDDARSLMRWGQSYYSEVFDHLAGLSDEKLRESQPVPWDSMVEQRLGRKPENPTIGDTILQVTMHSLYHRGQVNARLREIGREPPLVDYIVWIWLGRPAAEWP